MGLSKELSQIVSSDPGTMQCRLHMGIDAQQVLLQGCCFFHPHLIKKIILSIEIADLHPVIIGDDESLDPGAQQADCDIGSQSPGAGNAHHLVLQLVQGSGWISGV